MCIMAMTRKRPIRNSECWTYIAWLEKKAKSVKLFNQWCIQMGFTWILFWAQLGYFLFRKMRPSFVPHDTFYQNCTNSFARLNTGKINWSLKFRHLLKFYCCYGNKNDPQSRLKIEKLPFWTKFKRLETFFKN